MDNLRVMAIEGAIDSALADQKPVVGGWLTTKTELLMDLLSKAEIAVNWVNEYLQKAGDPQATAAELQQAAIVIARKLTGS